MHKGGILCMQKRHLIPLWVSDSFEIFRRMTAGTIASIFTPVFVIRPVAGNTLAGLRNALSLLRTMTRGARQSFMSACQLKI
jgi:hypothetical protein